MPTGSLLRAATGENGRSARVCAVVVTFFPDLRELGEVVGAAARQTHAVLVVDNTPGTEPGEDLGSAGRSGTGWPPPEQRSGKVELILNRSNQGLSRAYNQAISIAAERGYDFVLLLDQDSQLLDGAVEELLTQYRNTSQSFAVGAVAGRNVEQVVLGSRTHRLLRKLTTMFRERAYRAGRLQRSPGVEEIRTFTNSGTLLPLSVVREVGSFDESLFVDAIDYELSLRLRNRGCHLFEATAARLSHRQGELYVRKVAGRTISLPGFPVQRGYYIVRDTLQFAQRWWRRFPRDVAGILASMTMVTVGALIALPDHGARVRAVLAALSDYGRTFRP